MQQLMAAGRDTCETTIMPEVRSPEPNEILVKLLTHHSTVTMGLFSCPATVDSRNTSVNDQLRVPIVVGLHGSRYVGCTCAPD